MQTDIFLRGQLIEDVSVSTRLLHTTAVSCAAPVGRGTGNTRAGSLGPGPGYWSLEAGAGGQPGRSQRQTRGSGGGRGAGAKRRLDLARKRSRRTRPRGTACPAGWSALSLGEGPQTPTALPRLRQLHLRAVHTCLPFPDSVSPPPGVLLPVTGQRSRDPGPPTGFAGDVLPARCRAAPSPAAVPPPPRGLPSPEACCALRAVPVSACGPCAQRSLLLAGRSVGRARHVTGTRVGAPPKHCGKCGPTRLPPPQAPDAPALTSWV